MNDTIKRRLKAQERRNQPRRVRNPDATCYTCPFWGYDEESSVVFSDHFRVIGPSPEGPRGNCCNRMLVDRPIRSTAHDYFCNGHPEFWMDREPEKYVEGMKAAIRGEDRGSNPYTAPGRSWNHWTDWSDGWDEGYRHKALHERKNKEWRDAQEGENDE